MKKYILSFVVLWCSLVLQSQQLGTWKAYPAYQIATANIPVGHKVYSLCEGNLFSYNTDDGEVYGYDKVNTLSDCKIEFMAHNSKHKLLVLVYKNCNIDLLYEDDTVVNLPQFKNYVMTNKTINSLSVHGDYAYLSTNFGVVEVNLVKAEIGNTYNLNKDVKSCVADDEYIYAAADKLYRGMRTDNLQDPGNWAVWSETKAEKLCLFKSQLICQVTNDALYKFDMNTREQTRMAWGQYKYITVDSRGERLLAGKSDLILEYEDINTPVLLTHDTYSFNCLTYANGIYWASDGKNGLQPYKVNANKALKPTQTAICPNSPIRDLFYYMKFEGDRLLVAGGSLNYFEILNPGTAMYYEDDKWTNFEEDLYAKTGYGYFNTTTIVQDPKNPQHHFVGTARHGFYEFLDGKFERIYHTQNSPLEPVETGSIYVSTSGMTYDKEGNLWLLNNQTDNIIKVLKPDGTWLKLPYNSLKGAPTCDFMLFDSSGNIWINSRRSDKYKGIFFLNTNGTIDNQKDDINRMRRVFVNQDGVEYNEIVEFYGMAEDREGRIWIGTTSGLFVVTRPDQYPLDGFRFEQVKIARNDGSGLADYLLNGVPVTNIAIDGADRKWVTTMGNGVYLISADGQEMIHHFTAENSPLLSNNVHSVAIHQRTGEVYFGTENGLVSFVSDAVAPQRELSDDNIYAYPNPVKPDYNGPVTVTGLTFDAEVKITSSTGQLIYQGTSNGGLFTWNLRNKQGKRVASGVYNVITSTSDGEESVVTKIIVIH